MLTDIRSDYSILNQARYMPIIPAQERIRKQERPPGQHGLRCKPCLKNTNADVQSTINLNFWYDKLF